MRRGLEQPWPSSPLGSGPPYSGWGCGFLWASCSCRSCQYLLTFLNAHLVSAGATREPSLPGSSSPLSQRRKWRISNFKGLGGDGPPPFFYHARTRSPIQVQIIFLTGSRSVAQADLELVILMSLGLHTLTTMPSTKILSIHLSLVILRPARLPVGVLPLHESIKCCKGA